MEARTLVIAHAHPDHSLGGGEIAAYAHWSELRQQGDRAVFVARASSASSGRAGAPFTARASDGSDLLFHVPNVDHFRHSQPARKLIYEDLRALLDRVRPTAVHFHHYVHLGLELVREVRKHNPNIPIVLTLHDFLGMCHAQGQMVKTNGMLCQRALPLDCHACFREHSPQAFFMRELFVKSFFKLIDAFVSPSRLVRDRYVAWGLPAERFMVLENGQAAMPSSFEAHDAAVTEGGHARFVVMGQLSRQKGTLVLIEAVRSLPKEVAKRVSIDVHGTLQHADEAFKSQFLKACEELSPTLRYCGPYLPKDTHSILEKGAWLIVPSLWWENSPMVIQEALRARCPVIASNIGGMAEKVQHGVNGLHFRVNSPSDLGRTIELASADPQLWGRLRSQIKPPPTLQHTVGILRSLYAQPRANMVQTLANLREAHGLD